MVPFWRTSLRAPILKDRSGERFLHDHVYERSSLVTFNGKFIRVTGVLVVLFGVFSYAKAETARDKLNGSWAQEGETLNSPASAWSFGAYGDNMRVTQTEGGKKIAEFKCDTKGAGCEVKIDGKKVILAMWFNGEKLVQMETKGSDVVERTFAILPEGDVMEVTINPIVPIGKTETIQYKRVQPSAQGK